MRIEDFNFLDLPHNFKDGFYLEIPSERLTSFSLFSTTSHDTINVEQMERLLGEDAPQTEAHQRQAQVDRGV